ncbi:fimbrial protein [Caballeronia peredens]|nr:fimbrial protein [Caballeronia peredens]
MMKKIALSLIVASMALAGVAHATPGTGGGALTITGEVIPGTCDISGNGGGNNFSVPLPPVWASQLAVAGSFAGGTGFDITLTNCNPDSGKVHTFWEYGANTLSNGNLKNNGTATSVEVQLLDYNGTESLLDLSKADGAQGSQGVTLTSGAARLQYSARYVSPKGSAGPGSVTTSVTYSIIYE